MPQASRFLKCPQGFPGGRGSDGKEAARNAGDPGSPHGMGRSPGEGNETHFRTLTWRIPWTEEPGGLQSVGSQRVRYDLATNTHTGDSKLVTTIQHTNEMLDSTYDTVIKKTMPEADEPSLAWHLVECRQKHISVHAWI